MGQLSRLFVISRIFFMGFLISGTAFGETSPITEETPPISMMEAIPDDNVAQVIHATLEPMISAFPPLQTRPRHQRIDVNRVVLDFYTHRQFRAAWTHPDDVTQLLKNLNETQIDGLEPADFRGDDLAMAQASMQSTAPTPEQQAAFDLAATRTYLTALLQLRRGKVDPARLDMHWNFDITGADPRDDVQNFLPLWTPMTSPAPSRKRRRKRRCMSVCAKPWRSCA